MMKSKIQTPLSSRTRAIILGGDKKAELLVNGYLRRYTEENVYIPQDVIGIMVSYYSAEVLHIIQQGGKHFAINVDDVLNDFVELESV